MVIINVSYEYIKSKGKYLFKTEKKKQNKAIFIRILCDFFLPLILITLIAYKVMNF